MKLSFKAYYVVILLERPEAISLLTSFEMGVKAFETPAFVATHALFLSVLLPQFSK
jgi:hypothetical protein